MSVPIIKKSVVIISTNNFMKGGKPVISSLSPVINKNNMQVINTNSVENSSLGNIIVPNNEVKNKAGIETPSPPSWGMLFLWELRSFGSTIKLLFKLMWTMKGINLKENKKEIIRTIAESNKVFSPKKIETLSNKGDKINLFYNRKVSKINLNKVNACY